ncbi:MAG TPA: hypothetical protein VFA53_00110 [Xanthobacteraceae bacterium]|nr:hypothetical protein [Xanthobacteraceae bacterium]
MQIQFQFLNNPDSYVADVFPDHVRLARAGDTDGSKGASSMSLATFYAIAEQVAAVDPSGPLGEVDFS